MIKFETRSKKFFLIKVSEIPKNTFLKIFLFFFFFTVPKVTEKESIKRRFQLFK
jgi:hypothetical protein